MRDTYKKYLPLVGKRIEASPFFKKMTPAHIVAGVDWGFEVSSFGGTVTAVKPLRMRSGSWIAEVYATLDDGYQIRLNSTVFTKYFREKRLDRSIASTFIGAMRLLASTWCLLQEVPNMPYMTIKTRLGLDATSLQGDIGRTFVMALHGKARKIGERKFTRML